MSLQAYQCAWYQLMLAPEAQNALNDPAMLQQWLARQPDLSVQVQAQFLQQPLRRLRQYQFMVRSNLTETLEVVYPYTHQLLNFQWPETVNAYFQAYPPKSYQLHGCIENFPRFLSESVGLITLYPFLEWLAAYELLEAQLLRAMAPEPPPNLNRMAVEDLTTVGPVLNPVFKVLTSPYPIHAVVSALQQKQPPEAWLPLEPSSTSIWMYRDRSFHCRFYQVNGLVLQFLEKIQQQNNLKQGAFSYQQYLECLFSHQEITLIHQQQFLALVHQLTNAEILWDSISLQ